MKLSKQSSALILSHFNERSDNAGFPPQLVRDYLLKKIKTIVYIEHAFPYAKDKRSSMTIYKNGKLHSRLFTHHLVGPAPLFYIADIFITWFFLLKAKTKYDLCVALDNLNVFSVAPFKNFEKIKKLVYYTIDYTPTRFPNKILNDIYHFLDRFACYHSDVIWILSKRMIPAREKNGVNKNSTAPSVLLPMGADTKKIKILPENKINKNEIVFVGHITKKQGLQLIFKALPQVIKKIPTLKCTIIGHGPYLDELKKLAKKLRIENYINFVGFVEKQSDVEKILTKSSVGLAPYVPGTDNYTYYTDPGKPKLYLACGLPVIITDVPDSAKIIEEAGAGICIPYSVEGFKKALLQLLSNKKIYSSYRENAIKLSKQFDTNTLIANAVQKT